MDARKCRRKNREVLRQISTEHNTYGPKGGGKENVTVFECHLCEARWTEIEEWGLGDSGHFWNPIKSN